LSISDGSGNSGSTTVSSRVRSARRWFIGL
jgi:hypothetical protein